VIRRGVLAYHRTMRAQAARVAAAMLLPVVGLVGCSSSGASVGVSTVPPTTESSISATLTTLPVAVGNDNSHSGGGNSGGGGSGKGGGGGSGTPAPGTADVITVTKCWSNGPQLLIKASSTDPLAQLYAYRPDGVRIGLVQNGGSNRYGGTVYAGQPSDPGEVTIRSSSGGSITVKTTPFQPEP
jgi:hypothetical protein